MKLSKYLALFAAIAGVATVTARAEDAPKTDPAPAPDAPKHERGAPVKLTDAEKAKLKAAHEAADKDPAVIAAKAALEKLKDSDDRKAKGEARKALGEATKAAMLKADPTIADLLKKVGPGEGRGRRGEGRGPKKDGDTPPPAPAPDAPAK